MQIHKKIFHKLPSELQVLIKRLLRPDCASGPAASVPPPEPAEYGCVNCGSDDHEPVYPQYGIARCKNCGLIYTRRRKSNEELRDFYSHSYLELALATNYINVGVPEEIMNKFLKENDKSYFLNIAKGKEYIFDKYILPYLPESAESDAAKRFIEVGCAWGSVLFAAQAKGFMASGYEVSRPNCELGKRLGLDIHNGEFSLADLPNDSVDAIMFHHSLEHIPNPMNT